MMGPARTMPSPAPMPRIDEMIPMPVETRAAGNSSRMMPKARGKTAPPAPWMTRPTSITGNVEARALSSVPTERMTSTTTRLFSLPTMSPTRPTIGVAIAALRR